MSELQQYYDDFRTGYWADPDPAHCRCRGSGYALSEVDTWHQCPYHFKPGQGHPEDDHYSEPAEFDQRRFDVLANADRCPECGDGENFPPSECPHCHDGVMEALHGDDSPLEDDENHLPHSQEDTYRRDDDIPF